MRVNLRKLMQLIIFFAHHETVKPLGKTKLFKLLYFTDVTHIRTVGEPITGAEYLKYPYGPVPMQGNYVLKELRKHRLIRQEGRRITALQMPNMTIFTTQEITTISTVIEECGKDSATALSWRSHQESAWLLAEELMPLNLIPAKQRTEEEGKNAKAIAFLEQWYATPDDKPPGYWDDLEEEINAHPIHFGDGLQVS